MQKVHSLLKLVIGILLISFQLNIAHAKTTTTSSYAKTKYPIILVHGAFGFDTMFGFVDYFYKIPQDLSNNGAKVYVAQVSAVNTPIVRGEQLLIQINQILAETGATKVNLMVHSLGAPTGRYVASIAPSKVASVTTIGGANAPPTFISSSPFDPLFGYIQTGIGMFIDFSSGGGLPQNGVALQNWNVNEAAAFNKTYPEGMPPATNYCLNGVELESNGVRYMSWTGVANLTNLLDPSDYILSLIGAINSEKPNDGPVGKCGSHLGKVIRDDYNLNHLDETNLIFGLKGLTSPDVVALYRIHANRLKVLGL